MPGLDRRWRLGCLTAGCRDNDRFSDNQGSVSVGGFYWDPAERKSTPQRAKRGLKITKLRPRGPPITGFVLILAGPQLAFIKLELDAIWIFEVNQGEAGSLGDLDTGMGDARIIETCCPGIKYFA